MTKHQNIRFEVVSPNVLPRTLVNWGHTVTDFLIDPLQLCFAIDRIVAENRVRRILIIFRIRELPMTNAHEIAVSLDKCKKNGIQLTAYSDHLNLAILLAMSPCMVRVCPPLAGPLKLVFPIEHISVSQILPKFGLTIQMVRSSKFKVGAVDFNEDGIPEEVLKWEENISRENLEFVLKIIAQHINKPIDLNRNPIYSTAVEALEDGLLTHVAYEELLDRIDHPLISVSWHKATTRMPTDSNLARRFSWGKPKLALIELDAGNSFVWSSGRVRRTVSTIYSIFDRLEIKGVLMVLNYQGGDLSDADRIWCLLMELRNQIPIVVYARNALSAGYHVASAANQIVVNQLTLLGAIGTMVGRVDASMLLEKLGIESNFVGANQSSLYNRLFQPFQDYETHELQRRVEVGAKLFQARVAMGRNLQNHQLDEVSNGRIFSASEAIKNKLADNIGTATTSAELLNKMVNSSEELPFIRFSAGSSSLTSRLIEFAKQVNRWLST